MTENTLNVHVKYNPKPSDLLLFEDFFKAELESRKNSAHFNSSNHDHTPIVSIQYLVENGRFKSGGITWLSDINGKIYAFSGFYIFEKLLICGVRTLINSNNTLNSIGIHAEFILSKQVDIAKQLNLSAAVVTFNQSSYRIFNWIKKHCSTHKSLIIYQRFNFPNDEIVFNMTKQKIAWAPMTDHNVKNKDILNMLDGKWV